MSDKNLVAHKYQALRMNDVYGTVADEFLSIAEDIQLIIERENGNFSDVTNDL